ncbi:MAG: hypothetical protein HQL52_00610 [Magnetococcales bacterium]|nr:hypothetical protein [Magnetococcales bacterium]
MKNSHEYRFIIDGFTPETIPMARLAEYMADLATIFGERESVHFGGVESGSAKLIPWVEPEAAPKVKFNIEQAKAGLAPKAAQDAIHNIDKLLREDNTTGRLTNNEGAEIIPFPGREAPTPTTYGPFNQEGSLDGTVFKLGGQKLGGQNDLYPVGLQSENIVYNCVASLSLVKCLSKFIMGPELRVWGKGRWFRSEEGQWELRKFRINSFDPLEEKKLTEVVKELRAIPGSGWNEIEDPFAELHRIRHGDDGVS